MYIACKKCLEAADIMDCGVDSNSLPLGQFGLQTELFVRTDDVVKRMHGVLTRAFSRIQGHPICFIVDLHAALMQMLRGVSGVCELHVAWTTLSERMRIAQRRLKEYEQEYQMHQDQVVTYQPSHTATHPARSSFLAPISIDIAIPGGTTAQEPAWLKSNRDASPVLVAPEPEHGRFQGATSSARRVSELATHFDVMARSAEPTAPSLTPAPVIDAHTVELGGRENTGCESAKYTASRRGHNTLTARNLPIPTPQAVLVATVVNEITDERGELNVRAYSVDPQKHLTMDDALLPSTLLAQALPTVSHPAPALVSTGDAVELGGPRAVGAPSLASMESSPAPVPAVKLGGQNDSPMVDQQQKDSCADEAHTSERHVNTIKSSQPLRPPFTPLPIDENTVENGELQEGPVAVDCERATSLMEVIPASFPLSPGTIGDVVLDEHAVDPRGLKPPAHAHAANDQWEPGELKTTAKFPRSWSTHLGRECMPFDACNSRVFCAYSPASSRTRFH
ncbi:hypothetical protein B0H13DRAFT_2345353 [Mycena leptocephala]|nr:hypothetical protein B0H13DRAFT_2345353 [Mycena leptocephala]